MQLKLKKSEIPAHLLMFFKKTSHKSGDLVNIPNLVAEGLREDGWILRQDIIWAKPSPMPESVKNRCTKSHEYVFLLTKKMGYFYDAEAIKEQSIDPESLEGRGKRNDDKFVQGGGDYAATRGGFSQIEEGKTYTTRNRRSVWTVSSQGYPGAHFATYPPKLIEPMILAGTSEYGACVDCGAPWKRVVEEKQLTRERPNDYVKRSGEDGTGNSCANSVAGVESKTVGWEPTCDCFLDKDQNCRECGTSWESVEAKANIGDWGGGKRGLDTAEVGMNRNVLGGAKEYAEYQQRQAAKKTVSRDMPCECFTHKVQPCIVLDPFIGSGTTCCVAIAHGRHSIGIDLSEKYLRENAIPRIEGELLARPALKYLTGRQATRLDVGKKLA